MTNARQSKATVTVYYYLDTRSHYQAVMATHCNFWLSRDFKEPIRGQLGTETYSANYFFLESRSVTLDISDYDPILAKIDSLESQLQKDLADSHVRQQKLKDRIAELKCIGHDQEEHAKEQILGDEDHFYQADHTAKDNPFDQFDDDIPF